VEVTDLRYPIGPEAIRRNRPLRSSLLLGLIVWGCSFSIVQAQTTRLDPFVGKDVGALPEHELATLYRIVGKTPPTFPREPSAVMDKIDSSEPGPWYVWKTGGGGRTRYIVFLGSSPINVPGGSYAGIQLFDAAARRIGSWSFQVGWRIRLIGASLKPSKALAANLIVIRTVPEMDGPPVDREYFTVAQDQLRFVRMEDRQGNLLQNNYLEKNLDIGIIPDARTTEQWIALLESPEKADVLSALFFLCGKHLDEFGRPGFYSALFRELANSPRMRDLIQHLTVSDDDWIRQAARLATRETGLSERSPE